jgi:D-amino-acid dehydrogenase
MRVAVIGAGIVGVTTAYELASDGHAVTVFERRGSVAAETSFANAGIVAPGYVTPWAAPGMPGKVLRQAFGAHAAVRVGPRLSAATLGWMWRWWRACSLRSYQANRARLQRLAFYSRARLHDLVKSLNLEYERGDGVLVLFRQPRDLALARPGIALLESSGTKFRLLDAAQCREVEPWLDADAPLHGGLYLPDDEVGNCRQFAHLLRGEAQAAGAEFRFHTEVRSITAATPGAAVELLHEYMPPAESTQLDARGGEPHSTLVMPAGPETDRFDAVVVCAAMQAPALLRPLGLRIPLQAVHGYSITAPLRDDPQHPHRGPRAGLMDERYKVAISRLGTRVRVAGAAEIGHSEERQHDGAIATLYKVLHDWFPGAARLSHVQRWKGARPMLPDGPPVLGASGVPGVFVNLGHGSSGWALACGSARVLADAVAGRAAAIDLEGLGIERLRP